MQGALACPLMLSVVGALFYVVFRLNILAQEIQLLRCTPIAIDPPIDTSTREGRRWAWAAGERGASETHS